MAIISLYKVRSISFTTVIYLSLIIITLVSIFPLYFTVVSSLKTPSDLMKNPTQLFPKRISLRYYLELFRNLNILQSLNNSIFVALATVLVSIVISTFSAYSVVRFYPRSGRMLGTILMFTYMFPRYILAVPFYLIMGSIKLTNTRIGLIVAYLSFTIPFSMYMLIGFFQSVPIEIEEAAVIDGATRFQTFSLVAVPLITGGLIATSSFAFINAWNEFLYALILVGSGKKQTVATLLYNLMGGETIDWGGMLAASVVVIIPAMIFFYIMQSKFSTGVTSGAVKG